jgi:hypothetical protein
VVKRLVRAQGFDNLGDCRHFLTDSHINTDNSGIFLVDYGVNRDCGFAGLTVANDQFALPASDRNKRVDGLNPGL